MEPLADTAVITSPAAPGLWGNVMTKHLISAAILVAAWFCYMTGTGPEVAGVPALGGSLLVIGVALELYFWIRVRSAFKAKPATQA